MFHLPKSTFAYRHVLSLRHPDFFPVLGIRIFFQNFNFLSPSQLPSGNPISFRYFKGGTSQTYLVKYFKFFVQNPSNSSSIVTILIYCRFIITSLAFFFLRKKLL